MAKPVPTCACPRCGYDLSGAVDSWTEQCPVEGVCSECGLGFGWKYILNEQFRSDPLFYETAALKPFRAIYVTFRRTARPWRFWSWVKLEYAFRPQKMVECVAAGSLAVWLVGTSLLFALNYGLNEWHKVISTAKIPGAWLRIPRSLSLRENIEFTLWPAMRFSSETPQTIFVALIAIAWMSLMGGSFAILGDTLSRAEVRWSHVVRIAGYQLAILPIAWLAAAVVGYSNYWALVAIDHADISTFARGLFDACVYLRAALAWSTTLLIPIWILLWWGFGCSRYLQIKRPWIVAFVMAFTSGLAVVTAWLYYALSQRWL